MGWRSIASIHRRRVPRRSIATTAGIEETGERGEIDAKGSIVIVSAAIQNMLTELSTVKGFHLLSCKLSLSEAAYERTGKQKRKRGVRRDKRPRGVPGGGGRWHAWVHIKSSGKRKAEDDVNGAAKRTSK